MVSFIKILAIVTVLVAVATAFFVWIRMSRFVFANREPVKRQPAVIIHSTVRCDICGVYYPETDPRRCGQKSCKVSEHKIAA